MRSTLADHDKERRGRPPLAADKRVELWLPCVPPTTTAQQKRVKQASGGPVFFKCAKQLSAERTLEALLAPHAPKAPLGGPLRASIDAYWPPTKGDLATKAKRARFDNGGWVWHAQKPDVDNFAKAVLDALAALRYISNDKDIVSLTVTKRRRHKAGMAVSICPDLSVNEGVE